jgi:hypothetical protein
MFSFFKPKLVRWEYKILPIGSHESDDFAENTLLLDAMGQIGWEMVSVYGQYVIFKRHVKA